ncbi:G8 domain-containing protein [Natronoarchaeum rubrum]|uniref:G8 domain-containing protein n=1 Tax=Natronoarchaeum rubrum TaxID=755311 RepID=UPI00211117A0|nr:G8 domain-containing protein [Natronoarchaeum rubrum]
MTGDDGGADGDRGTERLPDVETLRTVDRRTLLRATGATAGAGLLGAAASQLLDGDGGTAAAEGMTDREAAMELVEEGAVTHRAVADGAWTERTTWDADEAPDDGARVHVPEGTTVKIGAELSARVESVRVDGSLRVDPATDTRLGVQTLVVAETGTLEVGAPETPVGPAATATIEFLDGGPIDEDDDPRRVGRGLIAMGRTRICGSERTSWTAAATAPEAGDATLELDAAPTGWSAGDRIVVAGLSTRSDEDEKRTIAAVDGDRVELDEPLRFDHVPPAEDLSAYVGHLDRNVRLRSETDETPRRGHVMFATPDVEVRHAGFYDLGRTEKRRPFTNPANGVPPRDVEPNPKARYAVHFHHVGVDIEDPARIVGCAVWGSPGWGYVNHGSHVVVEDSVSYEVTGAGFVAEAGNEIGAFRRNLALRSRGSGQRVDARQFREDAEPDPESRRASIDDFGHGGHGFWLQSPAVAVEENVAAGHRHYGIVFWNRALAETPTDPENIGGVVGERPNFPIENLEGQADLATSDRVVDGKVPSSFVALRSFRDNVVFACGGGVEISRHMFTEPHRRYDEYAVVERLTVHSVGDFVTQWNRALEDSGNLGLKVRYSANLLLRDCRLLGVDGTGTGIERNHAVENLTIENSTIDGWDLGQRAPTRGVAHLRDCAFDNDRNVLVETGATSKWNPAQRLRIEGTTLAGGEDGNVELTLDDDPEFWGLLGDESRIAIEDREAYLRGQASDAVPFPDESALEEIDGADKLGELTGEEGLDPAALVGKSNRELQSAYGVSLRGELLPDDAVEDERLRGALLGPAGETPETVVVQADAGAVSDPLSVGEDETASNGRYVAPGGASSVDYPPRSGQTRVAFEAPAGEYALWARVVTPRKDADSFWVTIDDRDWLRWDWIGRGHTWHWERVHDSDDDHRPATFDLDAGEHELLVAHREADTKLDQLLLADGDYRPFGPDPF